MLHRMIGGQTGVAQRCGDRGLEVVQRDQAVSGCNHVLRHAAVPAEATNPRRVGIVAVVVGAHLAGAAPTAAPGRRYHHRCADV